jgi:hypothetical protein
VSPTTLTPQEGQTFLPLIFFSSLRQSGHLVIFLGTMLLHILVFAFAYLFCKACAAFMKICNMLKVSDLDSGIAG